MTRQEKAYKAVDKLIATGWQFKAYSYEPMTGWWVLPGDEKIKAMRRGDPKPFYQGALDTFDLYVYASIKR